MTGSGSEHLVTRTVPYLAEIARFTRTVTDPVNSNTLVEYTIAVAPVATPEPPGLLMLGMDFWGSWLLAAVNCAK